MSHHPCQNPEYAALLATAGPPIAADWLRDRDLWCEAQELLTRPPFSPWADVHRFLQTGIGIGSGSGSGNGRGIGNGSGNGNGRGSGSGRGSGRGRGSGIGSAIGIGRGIGRGNGHLITQRVVMRIGQAYLVHLGDWHTFVGRVKDQLGPLTYVLEAASKVDIASFGDRWHELAAGDETIRRQASYWHCEGEVIVPLSIAAITWSGKTPQEDGLPGQ